jgi:hypothetical protein
MGQTCNLQEKVKKQRSGQKKAPAVETAGALKSG